MSNRDPINILKTMVYICNLAPGKILVCGGAILHPTLLGLPRVRPYSDDIDFFIPKSSTLEKIRKKCSLGEMMGTPYSLINGVYAFLFVNRIKDLSLKETEFNPIVFSTNEGLVYTLPLELIAALKLRRGIVRASSGFSTRRGTIFYGKDIIDSSGLVNLGNPESFADYMNRYTYNSCGLNEPYICARDFSSHPAVSNLHPSYRGGAEKIIYTLRNTPCRFSI